MVWWSVLVVLLHLCSRGCQCDLPAIPSCITLRNLLLVPLLLRNLICCRAKFGDAVWLVSYHTLCIALAMCYRLSDLRKGNKLPVCALEEHSKLSVCLITMLVNEHVE